MSSSGKIIQVVSADIVDGTIATADIAAGAVSQGLMGTATGSTTTSTSYATPAGNGSGSEWRVDITTTAGSTVLIVITTVFSNNIGIGSFLAFSVDGGAEEAEVGVNATVTGAATSLATQKIVTGLSAAAHVIRARYKTAATGSMGINAGTLSVLELKR